MRHAWMGPAALIVLVTGCAALLNPFQPGARVNPDVAARWGCDYGQVMNVAHAAKAEIDLGKNYVPQVGWTACRVLAYTGAPNEVDMQQTTMGRSTNWWYRTDTNVHLVSLVQQGDDWVVDYVGW